MPMNAIEMLKEDHDKVKKLLKDLTGTDVYSTPCRSPIPRDRGQ